MYLFFILHKIIAVDYSFLVFLNFQKIDIFVIVKIMYIYKFKLNKVKFYYIDSNIIINKKNKIL